MTTYNLPIAPGDLFAAIQAGEVAHTRGADVTMEVTCPDCEGEGNDPEGFCCAACNGGGDVINPDFKTDKQLAVLRYTAFLASLVDAGYRIEREREPFDARLDALMTMPEGWLIGELERYDNGWFMSLNKDGRWVDTSGHPTASAAIEAAKARARERDAKNG